MCKLAAARDVNTDLWPSITAAILPASVAPVVSDRHQIRVIRNLGLGLVVGLRW